ncbi:MAG: TatD family hydrolase [bacterium]|nr:TatD family hydrolase [bacterium]
MFIDSHAHLNFSAFKDDCDEVIKSSLAQNTWVANVGSQYSTSKRAVQIAERYPQGVYAVVGLHPVHLFEMEVTEEGVSFTTKEERFDPQKYRELALSPKVVGIGECGLEYFHLPAGHEAEIKAVQKEAFQQQIKLAAEIGKALVVHSRDAYEDVYDIIKIFAGDLKSIIIHSYIGSGEQLKKFVDLGCFVSFNGIITFKPRKEKKPGQSDPTLLEAVKDAPLDRILLETDCPWLSPEPLRGQRNLPVNVKYVAAKIAEIKGISVAEVEKQATENTRKVYGI